MSNWREQLSEDSETEAALAWLNAYYHIPVLVVLVFFAFWNRIRNWSNFVIDGTVYYSGNDPWYHLRSTEYAVENNLGTMPFDPWTYFPIGTSTGQFGTLFDQVIALVALIIGLGSPSESLVRHVFLVAPAFFGLAICIPAYLIGRRLGGRFGGLVTVGFIAFAPDRLLQVSVAGNVQHHSAEMLFMALSMLGMMVALTVAEREKPVYELVKAGEIDTLRGTIGWSILTGVAIGVYLWTWPPGVWIFGILGAFFVIHLSLKHIRGRSPEHAAFVGVISFVTAGILQLSTVRTMELSATSRSILIPVMAFVVAGGVLFLAWLSREVEQKDLTPAAYPGIVGGVMITATALVWLLLPDLFSFFYGQIDRVFGFITSPGQAAGTIGEAQPPNDRLQHLYDRYQLAVLTAAIGGLIIIAREIISNDRDGQELLILIWAVFIVSATFTQVRFGYYLTIPIGALNAVLVSFLMKTLGSAASDDFHIETYQVLTVAVVILVMFVPLLGVPWIGADANAVDAADGWSQPEDVVAWDDGLTWLSENTPEQGQYANPDGDPMEQFGTFDRTDDFEYPDGSYGVLSWWDYGHWITTSGERIPNANPFQQGASGAADFLLAQDEDEALSIMEENFDENENAQTRYVMVDWMMVETETIRPIQGKFFAPTEFHDEFEPQDFFERVRLGEQDPQSPQDLFSTSLMAHEQPYYESMVSRLYHYHGSQQDPEPIGFQRGGLAEGENPITVFDTVEEAEEWADERIDRSVGGFGVSPSESVEALEHFRLVHQSDVSSLLVSEQEGELQQQHGLFFGKDQVFNRDIQNSGILDAYLEQVAENPQNPTEEEQLIAQQQALDSTINNPAWTKTFERVPGATIEGSGGSANEAVTLTVEMEPENGEPFTYQQRVETDENGEFTATVPYATDGYDEWGVEEGYTDTDVRATGNYEVLTQSGLGAEFDVSEGQVIGEDDSVVEVDLVELEPQLPEEDEPEDDTEEELPDDDEEEIPDEVEDELLDEDGDDE